jgi:2-methylisocitrate lyase-like PEP mutase family enzyme
MKKRTTQLKELFLGNKIFVMPGIVDAYEAKIVEASGFKACYMSGSRTSAARGYPDAGFLTMNEMVENAHYIAEAINVPLLSDADTGYGNALNVRRTIQEFISAGAAGVHLEDQVSPKRCGYMPGKQVIELEEAAGKIRAAVDVRNELDPDFVIIARTDARGAVGGTLDDAIHRSEVYRQVGADVIWIEGLSSIDELKYVIERVQKPYLLLPEGIPLEEQPSEEELENMGIICLLYPGMLFKLTTPLLWEYLHDINARGSIAQKEWEEWIKNLPRKYPPAPSFFQIAGMPNVKVLEGKYLSPKELDKYSKSLGISWGKEQM